MIAWLSTLSPPSRIELYASAASIFVSPRLTTDLRTPRTFLEARLPGQEGLPLLGTGPLASARRTAVLKSVIAFSVFVPCFRRTFRSP